MPDRPVTASRRSRTRSGAARRRRRATSRRAATRKNRTASILRGLAITAAVTAVMLFAGVMVTIAIAAHALNDFAQDRGGAAPLLTPPPPEPGIAGYGVDQLAHACTIITVGRGLALEERDQTIAVMTAMGESSLRNLSYGDWETSGVTNPDGSRTTSVGLFQQQDNWGSRDARLDPSTAATLFYRAMVARVPERAGLEPTLVAHRTQVNADPQHYARYWESAVRVVAALNAEPLSGDSARGVPPCPSP
ncbi:peptidase M23 [Microbacterium sp. HJ5]